MLQRVYPPGAGLIETRGRMSELRLDVEGARRVLLAAQGLDRRPRRRATKKDVLETIRRMGALQIDTIHVVARSPYLVLWSRLGDYDPRWLDELLAGRKLFEYWAHEACFLPIESYPLFRHRMLDPLSMGWKYSHGWIEKHREQGERVLAHIREHGPARSADFERKEPGPGGGWWGWKPEKRALESLFTAGELMIARRGGGRSSPCAASSTLRAPSTSSRSSLILPRVSISPRPAGKPAATTAESLANSARLHLRTPIHPWHCSRGRYSSSTTQFAR